MQLPSYPQREVFSVSFGGMLMKVSCAKNQQLLILVFLAHAIHNFIQLLSKHTVAMIIPLNSGSIIEGLKHAGNYRFWWGFSTKNKKITAGRICIINWRSRNQ